MNVLAYPAKAGRNPDVLKAINDGNYTLDGLRKQFGISPAALKRDYGAKSNGRGRPKQPKPPSEPKRLGRPPKAAPMPLPEVSEASFAPTQPNPKKANSPQPEPKPRPRGLIPLAIVTGGIGIGLSISSAALDWSFCRTLSQDPTNSYIFGGIGILAGCATMVLPSVAYGLGPVGRILMGIVAALFLVSSLIVSISFASTNIGNTIAANGNTEDKAAYLRDAFAAKAAARKQIIMTDDAAVLEQRVSIARGSVAVSRLRASNDCLLADESYYPCREMIQLRAAEKEAIRRDRLDAELADLQRQKDELPASSGKDPGAVSISRALLGSVVPEQVSFTRSIQFGILANMGCLLLVAAMALFRRRIDPCEK